MLQTEYEFTLPRGFIGPDGTLHREGIMRLATAADEIVPLKDPRVKANGAYLSVVLLSRVVLRLGTLEKIDVKTIENLFAADLAYLQDLYRKINYEEAAKIPASCPKCQHAFEVEAVGLEG